MIGIGLSKLVGAGQLNLTIYNHSHMEYSQSAIAYSCYHQAGRQGESFVSEHAMSFIMAGSVVTNTGMQELVANQGSLHLVRRNQLLRFAKHLSLIGEFKSLSLHLGQDLLQTVSKEYNLRPSLTKQTLPPAIPIEVDAVMMGYLQSVLVYHQNTGFTNQQVIDLKVREGVLLALERQPALANVLFDFSDPHKIDLEAFMTKNYLFNVRLERFAYLTGRSLATFKRDFEKIFHTSPHRWLQQKRLQEAYFLLKEKGRTASEVYLDLGFEDLSHFSFAFKKQFGQAPSRVTANR